MATIAAIVPAAGCGARAALNGNKILAPLAGRPLLFWTLRALAQASPLLERENMALKTIVIAARREEFELITPLTREASHPAILLAEGGQTRQESVWKAVQARAQAADYVLVHDAARPLVSASLIAAVCKRAQQCGAAIAATQASDTVKIMGADGNGLIESTLNRQNVYLAQTPQVFSRELFWKAFSRAEEEGFHGTDCASVLERAGYPVAIVDGEAVNFKVTYPQDLERAENLLLREEQVN